MKNHDDRILFEFPLPDFKRDEIKIKFHDHWIYIEASSRDEIKEERKGFSHDETTLRKFDYKAALPENAYTRNAKIDFQNGVLRIEIPKQNR